jgi:hypothetical protein
MKCLAVVAFLFLMINNPFLMGQSTDATVSGMVFDPSSRYIAGAQILILNEATGVRYAGITNTDGLYTVPILPPGQYRVQVSKDGFKTIIKPGIILNVQAAVVLNFTLPLGATSETVTVEAGASQINTTDGSVSTVVDRKFVENIPLNGRSFQDLILLTPGVVTNSPQGSANSGASGEFSVNGQRTESNVYTVDGVSANTGGYIYGYGTSGTSGSVPSSSALGTTQSLVSVDALQEFRVASSSYSAEYGLSPGGQFSFTTRSGTNQIHGTAFDYLRNNFFDANDWFNDNLKEPITALRQNDFGGTLGGPVFLPKVYDGTNKSFFFFSYEGLRLMQPQAAQTLYVPSLALRQEAPSALQPVLNGFPIPTGFALANGLAPFVQVDSLPGIIDSTGVRFDDEITPKLKAFFRFSDTQSATQTRYLSVLSKISQSSFTNTLGLTQAFAGNAANEFRLNYTSSTGGATDTPDDFEGAQAVDLLSMQGLGPRASASVYLPGFLSYLFEDQSTQPQHVWNLVDSVSLSRGRQVLKFGVNFRRMTSRLQYYSPYVYSYFGSPDELLANSASLASATVYANSYPAYTNTGVFAQDEVRMSPKLGLSLGLRWELNPPPTQSSGTLPYVAEGQLADLSSLNLAPAGSRFWKTTYLNFAPRFGLAYQIRNQPGSETVIRTGGGVFFDSGQQTSTQPFGNSPGQSASASYSDASYPLSPAQVNLTIANPPVAPFYKTYYFPSKLQVPYTLQWNVSMEQAIGKAQSLTISYVGSNGRRLLSQQVITPGASNPNFNYLFIEKSGTTSAYEALQLKFQRALSRGLQVLASYNWAHSIDYGSQNIDFAQIRGNSDFDLRNSFNLAATYDLHADLKNKLTHTVVDGWAVDSRISTRTAFPVSLEGNESFDPNGHTGYSGLNLLQVVPVYVHVAGIAGNRAINPAAFSLPAAGDIGTAPRNFVRGFGASQIDLAVRRTFPIVSSLKLQFRAETFNILNHPDFGYIDSYYSDPQFGQATKMLDQSLGGLNPLYQQGGPRSMQFALKLLF